jgi:flavin prenyltransferase
MPAAKKRIIIGMSGASGAILGIEVLRILRSNALWETHLVVSQGGERTISQETDCSLNEVSSLADVTYDIKNIGAAIASGSFKTFGMIIIPCSMKTVAGIACGYSDNLLLRAADVILKERKKLVVVPRESPLSSIHLRNMHLLSEAGAVIIPPMVTYYNSPKTLADMNRHIAAKVLDQFDIEVAGFQRWGGVG